jgi:hypothetical protein
MKRCFFGFGWLLFGVIAFGQNYHITDFIPDSMQTWQIRGTVSSSFSGTDADNVAENTGVNETEEYNDESSVGITPTVYYNYWQVTPRRELSVYTFISSSLSKDFESTHSEDIITGANGDDDRTDKDLNGQIYG